MSLKLIQYLPLTRPKATSKLLKKLNKHGVNCILDLEDSAQDVFDAQKTRILKRNARLGLSYILDRLDSSFTIDIYVRINSRDSEYYEADLEYIRTAIPSDSIVKGIFLPKVEDYQQIEELHFSVEQFKKKTLKIVPMIETKTGMDNLVDILDSDRARNLFDSVHYGHFDYCLSAGIWPFYTPKDEEFWDIIKHIVSNLNKYSKSFIHTPFPFPKNEILFWQSVFYLTDLFPNIDIEYSTLNADLSLTSPGSNLKAMSPRRLQMSDLEKVQQAKMICGEFLENRANKRSFAVSGGCFIPPHQYFAAKRYLDEVERD